MRIFITGGTGFIGSHVVKRLLADHHQVTVYSRNPCRIKAFALHPLFCHVQGNLHEKKKLAQALEGHEVCVHLVLGWGNSPVQMLQEDTLHSVTLFELAIQAGIRHVLYASTVLAFGKLRSHMTIESALLPQNLYGATKAATEAYLDAIGAMHPIRTSIVRPCYTFGNPAEEGASVQPDSRIAHFVNQAENHQDIHLIRGDGTQMYPVEYLAEIFCRLILQPEGPGLVIAGTEQYVQWKMVAQSIINKMNSRSKIIEQDLGWQPGAFIYDCSSSRDLLGSEPIMEDYLEKHINYQINSRFPDDQH